LFDADPDYGFSFDADADPEEDPGYQNDADLDPQHWSVRYIPVYGASVADQEFFFIPDQKFSIPDPESATKKLSIFKPKDCF
jgi:hypothetical protein